MGKLHLIKYLDGDEIYVIFSSGERDNLAFLGEGFFTLSAAFCRERGIL
jgi:hypothetical protein